jgi:hypothetical protein
MKTLVKTISLKMIAVFSVMAVMGLSVAMAQAGTIDFSTPGTYVLATPWTYASPNTYESASVINIGGAHGDVVQLQLSDNPGDGNDWVDASVKCLGTYGTVRNTNITFETYIASATGSISQTQPAYSYLGVDLNGNGQWDGSSHGDALIIPWDSIGTPVYQQWFTDGYDQTTRVHVWQNGANRDFGGSISINMADLANAESAPGQQWGDLGVAAIYVGAGTWDADGFTYTAYIDNVTVVPEPGTLTLLGLAGLSGLATMWIRRRRSNG